ncbi:FAD:protein FMN transferase [Salsipaludibacter albus]|uniref:FAD:protein FMN transferase n=1 Tax=Salsipaludibacter albus TaxID=2849650 RepID=UPI001EE40412|nr:FAD:protein FMN transferase [Salsipaludibacter albus]MBY5163582.1 FAD:protein FMN transferase [Salsipaludibacter albus]
MTDAPAPTRRPLDTGLLPGRGAAEMVFPAMGSDAHVVVVDAPPGLLAVARDLVGRLEAHWSRFRPDSDVSRLARAEGSWVSVHADTHVLLERCRVGWELTAGRFDPTVLPALLAAGYDETFTAVAARVAAEGTAPDATSTPARAGPVATSAPGLAGLELDPRRRRARLPAGVALDPGAIGKGLAADLVVEWLLEHGAGGAMVNVGGDLRAAGQPPAPGGWGIEVAVPASATTVTLVVADAGIATSTPAYRCWQHDGRLVHHLLDPVTGQPAEDPPWSATVVAGAGWLAEVLATSLAMGDHRPLRSVGATGFVVVDDQIVSQPGLEEYRR